MGILDSIRQAVSVPPAVTLSEAVEEPAGPAPVAVAGKSLLDSSDRAHRIARDLALSIPSVRKAQHVIAGTIGTFSLVAYDANGVALPATGDRAWIAQPDARRTRQHIITRTVQDLIWHDRAVWRVTDRSTWGNPVAFERIAPERVSTIAHPLDPELVETWIIDASETPARNLVIFDGAGLGGLQRFGFDLLTIYGQLQAAAGRYARAPQPYALLKNSGEDLDDDEIDALLDSWEKARTERAVGYLNDVVSYETVQGYSARELQLVEAREHSALEVARLFALPSFALDASPAGSSITYGNVVDRRRDLVESLHPWLNVIEETLSLDDRTGRISGTVLPRGTTVRFDATAYTRDDAKTRMETWSAALAGGILTLEEIRAHEPLTRS